MSIFNMMTSGGGGGGLEYEFGAFTPSTTYESLTVTFSKTHAKPPTFAFAISDGNMTPTYEGSFSGVFDIYSILQNLWASNAGSRASYGYTVTEVSKSSTSSTASGILLGARSTSGNPSKYSNDVRFFLKEDSATFYNISASFQPNCKIVWLAIWLPDNWTPPTA